MSIVSFDITKAMSLSDMELAVDYLTDKDLFDVSLQDIKDKEKNTGNDKNIDSKRDNHK